MVGLVVLDAQACLTRGLNISVVGIPKTIDNDVDLIDRSFGFQTSVEAAQVGQSLTDR